MLARTVKVYGPDTAALSSITYAPTNFPDATRTRDNFSSKRVVRYINNKLFIVIPGPYPGRFGAKNGRLYNRIHNDHYTA